jgi:hypothetical protein
MTSTLQLLQGERGDLPPYLFELLPPILKTACSYFDHPIERESFLHGALPVLSRIMENCVIPLRHNDERLAIHMWIYGTSGMGKGAAGHAMKLLHHIRIKEAMDESMREAAYKNAEPDEAGNTPPPPTLHHMSIGLRSTPTTWVRNMKRHPEGVVHLVADTEGDTIKGGYTEHGSLRPMIKKGFAGEMEQFTLKEDGNVALDVWLSVLVTMTRQQMLDAIKDTEDGFFQRFIFHYVPPADGQFNDVFGDGSDSIVRKLKHLGYEVQDHYERNRSRDDEVRIRFTPEQQKEHQEVFGRLLPDAVDIHPNLHGSVTRLSSTVLRVAGLFTMLRKLHPKACLEVTCDDASWEAAAILRDYWANTIVEAFHLFDNSRLAMDGRCSVPDVVKEYVIKWREEDRTMPKAAVMKLQEMRERNNDIDAWLDRTKNPVAAVGRLQRQYAKP